MNTDTKPKHSPTPWTKPAYFMAAVYHEGPKIITKEPVSSEDTEHIIRCVNAHDALVEALELVASSGPLNNGLRDDATMDRVRAALALAGKGAP